MLATMASRGPGLLRAIYSGVDVAELRVSLIVLTALGLFVTLIAARNETSFASTYTMLVFAALIGINALMHIAFAIMFRAYTPGLVTALLLTLPVALLTLQRAVRERWLTRRAMWSVVPAAVFVHGPLLAAYLLGATRVARVFVR